MAGRNMTSLALIGLLCAAVGFAAGWIACWAAGVFQAVRPQSRCVCPAEHVTMANCPVHGWWPNRG